MLAQSAVFKASPEPRPEVRRPPEVVIQRVPGSVLVSRVRSLSTSIEGAVATGSEAWAVIAEDGPFVAWGLLATPASGPPSHLPTMKGRYWIWHCRTKAEWRGRGYYTSLLDAMVRATRESVPAAEIFVDTSPDNIAAIRAIERAGFERAATAFMLRIPKTRLRWALLRQAH